MVKKLIALLEFMLNFSDTLAPIKQARLIAFELENHLPNVIRSELKNFLQSVLSFRLLLLVLALVDNKCFILANQSLVDLVLQEERVSVCSLIKNHNGLLEPVEYLRILLDFKKYLLVFNDNFDDEGKEDDGCERHEVVHDNDYHDLGVEFLYGGHHCDSERV